MVLIVSHGYKEEDIPLKDRHLPRVYRPTSPPKNVVA
jgi:hypothetical protein